jgi:hypothetical protein
VTTPATEREESPRARGWRWATWALCGLALLVVVYLIVKGSSEDGTAAPAAAP